MGTALSMYCCGRGDFTRCENEIAEAMPFCPRGEATTPSACLWKVPHSRKRLQQMLHPSFYAGLDQGLDLCLMVHTEICA